jgi:hypothetical protein
MSDMERYGWDKFKEDGLEELQRIVRSRFFGDKDAMKDILNCYYSIYNNGKEHQIKGTIFYPSLNTDAANKTASANIGRLRDYLDEFYKSAEGIGSDFEIYFIAASRSYRLGVRRKKSEQERGRGEIMSYTENEHFIASHRPYMINTLIAFIFFISPLLCLICLGVLWVEKSHPSWVIFSLSFIGLIFSVVFGYAGIVLNKMQTSKLSNLYAKYFLRIASQNVSIVSYKGKCSVPGCPGYVYPSQEFKRGIGYIAKCTECPDVHRYSLDPITLEGRKIEY